MIRIFDILFSFFAIVLLSPILLLIALLIKIESKGDIFYIQQRVGKNNKDFNLIKFRTMHVNADKKGLLTIGNNDSRITKTGIYLRRYKLDENPSIF